MMKIETTDAGRISLPTGVLDIDVSADGQQLFAATIDGLYRVALSDPQPERIGQHDSWVSGVALADEDRRVVSAGYDGALQFRDLSRSEPDATVAAHRFWSWKMAVSSDRHRVASVSGQYRPGSEDYEPLAAEEPTVKVFDAHRGEALGAYEMLPSVQAVAFDPSGRYVAAANLMGDIAVWDVDEGSQVSQWRTPDFTSWGVIKSHCYIGGIHALVFSADGESLYAAGMGEMKDPMAGNGRQIWQRFQWRDTPTKIGEVDPEESGQGLMEALAMHPSGAWFVMGGRMTGGEWNVGMFAVDSGRRIGFLKTETRVTSACFSRDGNRLYLGGMSNQSGPRDGQWPNFGIIDRFDVTVAE